MNLESITDTLISGYPLVDKPLHLQLGDCHIRIQSNSNPLIEHLEHYFSDAHSEASTVDIDIIMIERDEVNFDIKFENWEREPGKRGRKDSYYDFPGGRILKKVRTGMVFLHSQNQRIAAGPCYQNDNQVINFINAQYMSWLQNRGWLICHAAGLQINGKGLGIAGFSGGGKSTLMLHLLESEHALYLTNDRLFVRRDVDGVKAAGIPKLPRINPGTIVHNPRLHSLITEQQRSHYLALPKAELWELEEKYDVMINESYGAGKMLQQTPLTDFIILNWKRDSDDELCLTQVDIEQRRDLLPAVMKSPGPFYQYADGHFSQDSHVLDEQAYVETLKNVNVYEASGGIDFHQLCESCFRKFLPG